MTIPKTLYRGQGQGQSQGLDLQGQGQGLKSQGQGQGLTSLQTTSAQVTFSVSFWMKIFLQLHIFRTTIYFLQKKIFTRTCLNMSSHASYRSDNSLKLTVFVSDLNKLLYHICTLVLIPVSLWSWIVITGALIIPLALSHYAAYFLHSDNADVGNTSEVIAHHLL